MRTSQPSLTPLPGVTAFGDAHTVYAQLFYDGVEQFYCQAGTCSQQVSNADGSASWNCNNLHCTCRPNTTFCGGVPASDLSSPINGLTGTLDIECDTEDNSTHLASCQFKQNTLDQLFGANGLPLEGCTFGECVRQSVIDSSGNLADSNSQGQVNTGPELSGGVIAGLAVVGGLVLLALFTLFWGLWLQRKARLSGMKDINRRRAALEWVDLTYIVPTSHGTSLFCLLPGVFSKETNGEKTILNALNGRLDPGQMMAILGPSGMCPLSTCAPLRLIIAIQALEKPLWSRFSQGRANLELSLAMFLPRLAMMPRKLLGLALYPNKIYFPPCLQCSKRFCLLLV